MKSDQGENWSIRGLGRAQQHLVCRVQTKIPWTPLSWNSSRHLPLQFRSLAKGITINQPPTSHSQFISTQQPGRFFRTEIKSHPSWHTDFCIIWPWLPSLLISSLCPITYDSHTGFLQDLPRASIHVPPSQLHRCCFLAHNTFPHPHSLLLANFCTSLTFQCKCHFSRKGQLTWPSGKVNVLVYALIITLNVMMFHVSCHHVCIPVSFLD